MQKNSSLPLLLLAVTFTGCATADQVATGNATAPAAVGTAVSTDHPGSIPVLLGLDPVRADLKLSSLQCSLLDSLRSEYKKSARNITAMGADDADGALRSEWDLRSLTKNYNRRALAVLSSTQQDRLRQIERQMLGGNLLSSPAEQKLLGLTVEQQQSLAAIQKQSAAKASSINARCAAGQLSSFWKWNNLHRLQSQTSSQMLSVLTPGQKKQWLVLSGQKSGLPKIKDPEASTKSLFEGY